MKINKNYIYKYINKKLNIRSNLIKNFFIFNAEKKSDIKKPIYNKIINKNTKKYYHTRIPKNSKNITLLNNNIIKNTNLTEIKIFTKINREIINDLRNFFTDCIYSNLNINYVTNSFEKQNKIFIKIPQNTQIEESIQIININKKEIDKQNQKLYLILEENSTIDIINYNLNKSSNSSYNTNLNIFLKKNSKLNYKIIRSNKKHTLHNNSIYVKQLESSNLIFTELSTQKDNITSSKFFFLLGKKSQLKKNSGYMLNNKTTCDLLYKINHYENESKSKTILKTTTTDNAKINFKGHIEVGHNVENTQSKLQCNGILLSNNSSIQLKPELSINNNNIICSHAATVGHINENVIKYMQSRGLDKKKCIKMLIKIFFHEILNNEKLLTNIINKI